MSQLLDTDLHDEESDSGKTQEAECSPSRCSSSSSIVSDAIKVEKSLEGSISLETAWTDSKHSSYLDIMEANFVQNMFARCYCMEDVCGGTDHHHHHHHHQHDCQTDFEENDDNTAESQLRTEETPEYKMYDWNDLTWRPALRAKLPATMPKNLLANPWVKHFRPRNVPSLSFKTSFLPARNDGVVKRDAESQETASPFINNVDDYQWTSNNISDSEKPTKPVADAGRTVYSKAGEAKDLFLSISSKSTSRNKRQVLWSTYKQVHRTRQKTGNHVQDGNTFNHDGEPLSNIILD